MHTDLEASRSWSSSRPARLSAAARVPQEVLRAFRRAIWLAHSAGSQCKPHHSIGGYTGSSG